MKKILLAAGFGCLLTLASCMKDGDDSIFLEGTNSTDIPSDSEATANPEIYGNTATIPNVQYTTVSEDGTVVIRLDMTGIQDTNTLEWMRLYGTGEKEQNIWLSIDGNPKGIKVYNTIDDENKTAVPVDLVFLVDNSGSMSEEANAIARDISEWASNLERSGLDIKFGCVGYGSNVGKNDYSNLVDGYGVSGAINLTSSDNISDYLNRADGTYATVGFDGPDRNTLESNAQLPKYHKAGGECGIQALRFADDLFSFRKTSNKIYVNFTDDANYHGNSQDLSVKYLLSDAWNTQKGTIHTVFSGDIEYVKTKQYGDDPHLMSTYTGGTILDVNSSFTGVTLSSLPVSDAMRNSYVIRFTNVEEYLDGRPHEVKITVMSPDGEVCAERTFNMVFSRTPQEGDDVNPGESFNGGFGDEKNFDF